VSRQLFRLQLFGRPKLQLFALDGCELAATGRAARQEEAGATAGRA
jgi:hypothetical protein